MAKYIFIAIFLGVFRGHVGKYIYVSEEQPWKEAQRYCRTHYTDLAWVNSQRDLQLLRATGPSGWIGLHQDPQNTYLWRWSGAGEMEYQNWYPNQPNNLHGIQPVVRVNSNGKWNDFFENTSFPFFCIYVPLMKINMSWENALEHCQNKSSAGLIWDKERPHVQNQMQKEGVSLVWIGLRFLGDQWLWVSGAPLKSDPLYELNPCPVNDRCGVLNSQGQLKTWDCEEELYFICE